MSSFSEELAKFKRIQRPTEDKNNPFYTRDELVQIEYGIYAPKNGVLKGMEEYDMKKELYNARYKKNR